MFVQRSELKGSTATLRTLAAVQKDIPTVWAAGIYLAAANVMTTALPLTPVDTGWLRASRYVTIPVVTGPRAEVLLGFGASYAPFVHDIHRNYVTGEWKFLSTALARHESTLARDASQFARTLIASGKVTRLDEIPRVHPTQPPLDDTNRAALEGLASRYRRRRSAKTAAKRLHSKTVTNPQRIARESAAALHAQRTGKPPPRPGRG